MAILYTQFLNVKSKKLLTGNFSTQGAYLQDNFDLLTELKCVSSRFLDPQNFEKLQQDHIFKKDSECGRYMFYIGVVPLFNNMLCVACITDKKTTEKLISMHFKELVDGVLSNKLVINDIDRPCYNNDEKLKNFSDSYNKKERTLSTNEILDNTHANLVENLDNLIYRGENINKLKSMSESLKYEAQFMSDRVKAMKRREQFQKYKNYAIAMLVLFVLVYFFFLRK